MAKLEMWFGTKDYGEFIRAPRSTADTSPVGYGELTQLLNGGAAFYGSVGSHKEYDYSWSNASAIAAAQKMKQFADGAYGAGLIYHVDPLIMGDEGNVMDARWGQPSMTGYDAPPLLPGVYPTLAATPANANGYPIQTAVYDLSSRPAATEPINSIFIPIPPGYKLDIGATGTFTGTARVYVTPVLNSGIDAAAVALTATAVTVAARANASYSSATYRGVRVWLGRTSAAASTLSLTAVMAQLRTIGSAGFTSGPWIGGMGHSGCIMQGMPRFLEYAGIRGGMVGHGVKLVEVGAWLLE